MPAVLIGLTQVDHRAHALRGQRPQLRAAGLAAGIQARADFIERGVFGQGRQRQAERQQQQAGAVRRGPSAARAVRTCQYRPDPAGAALPTTPPDVAPAAVSPAGPRRRAVPGSSWLQCQAASAPPAYAARPALHGRRSVPAGRRY
ncbi:hypothetical protein G6F68_013104 [Rhizopus microsporus]|nr:hypothetical protein G6F68_013104 [Rhizopus microsporus]